MPLFFPLSQYNLSFSSNSLSFRQFHFISPVFELLGFIPELKNPSVVELAVLIGVICCFCFNAIRDGQMPIAVFPLLNFLHISASAADETTLRIVLHFL